MSSVPVPSPLNVMVPSAVIAPAPLMSPVAVIDVSGFDRGIRKDHLFGMLFKFFHDMGEQ